MLRGSDERLDDLGVVLELGDDGALLQGEEVVAGRGRAGQVAALHSESAVDVLAWGAQPLGDCGGGQPQQGQLVDGLDFLDVGQTGTVLVLVPLPRDAQGLVVVLVSRDDDRDQVETGLDRAEGAAVAVAHADRAVLGANGDDRLDHAVVLDAGLELLVELGLADVQVDQQCGRVQHFERRGDGRHG